MNREGSRLMLENVYEHRPAEILELFERLRPQAWDFASIAAT